MTDTNIGSTLVFAGVNYAQMKAVGHAGCFHFCTHMETGHDY
jgi:hypothetical protein